MFTDTLSSNTLRGLKLLGKAKIVDPAYLAGGTAIALRLGHRQSIDLDFFTTKKFNEQIVLRRLERTGKFVKDQLDWQTIMGEFYNVKFSLFYYSYKILDQADDFFGIKIAGLKDLAPMKLHAIEDRGTKRDFIDLYWICRHIELADIGWLYDQKYGHFEERKYIIYKAINYFEDADRDKRKLIMLEPVDWENVKQFFNEQVRKLNKSWGIG